MMNSTDNMDVASVDTTVVMGSSRSDTKYNEQVDEEVAANDTTKGDEENADTSAADATTSKDNEDEASVAPDSRRESGSNREENAANDEEKAGAKAVDKDSSSVTDTAHSETGSNIEDVMIAVEQFESSSKKTKTVTIKDEKDAASTTGSVVNDTYQTVVAPENRRRLVGCTCGALLLMTFILFIIIANTVGKSKYTCPQTGDLFPDFGVPPCTFEECFDSKCDPDLTPFVCIENDGELHGGCAAAPWNVTNGVCSRACDRSCCLAMPIPEHIPTCDKQCSKEWCDNNHWCAAELAFQCIEGGATNGCSWDPIQWTYKSTEQECSDCCNTNTCWNHYQPEEEPEN